MPDVPTYKCSHCGAVLRPDASGMLRQCTYCGVALQGIPAHGPMAQATPMMVDGARWDVVLAHTGSNPIAVIQAVRRCTGLGLKESKDLALGAPRLVRCGISKDEAEGAQRALTAAGAAVQLRVCDGRHG